MKFSVLTSIYCKENPAYFDECMQSIWVNQTIKPTEMILVKDGKLTTALDQAIEEWSHKLSGALKIISLEKNVGLGNALNEGLKYCLYDWVFRMDTDDICVQDRFEKQLKFITDNPEVVLLGGQMREFISNARHEDGVIRIVPDNYQDIINFAHTRSPFNHITVAYKRNIILQEGGYQHHLLMEDYNLWLRIIVKKYRVENLRDILAYARTDGMYGRRRGMIYIKSEWQLYNLKVKLHFQSRVKAFTLFIVRSMARILPSSLLEKFYKLLRK